MRMPPMDRRLLIHTVEGTPKRLATKDIEPHTIEKVRLDGKVFFNPLLPQQSVGGNGRLFGDSHGSTKVDGEMPKFAIGDTIKFLKAPLTPKVCVISNVTPIPDIDGNSIHHLEMTLN